jgi:hypothetical protein
MWLYRLSRIELSWRLSAIWNVAAATDLKFFGSDWKKGKQNIGNSSRLSRRKKESIG